jgi:hypothetical protein
MAPAIVPVNPAGSEPQGDAQRAARSSTGIRRDMLRWARIGSPDPFECSHRMSIRPGARPPRVSGTTRRK